MESAKAKKGKRRRSAYSDIPDDDDDYSGTRSIGSNKKPSTDPQGQVRGVRQRDLGGRGRGPGGRGGAWRRCWAGANAGVGAGADAGAGVQATAGGAVVTGGGAAAGAAVGAGADAAVDVGVVCWCNEWTSTRSRILPTRSSRRAAKENEPSLDSTKFNERDAKRSGGGMKRGR